MNPYIYLRALKRVEHSVFCVEKGQKTYRDSLFDTYVAYSSGQQVKRSILESLTDNLNVQMAPIVFNYQISKEQKLENKEPWSPCDPTYVDQLIGGWMKAEKEQAKKNNKKKKALSEETEEDSSIDQNNVRVKKRRSPLSISAMRPLHPLLSDLSLENITFDRSARPNHHPVNVRIEGSDKLLTEEEIEAFLNENQRSLSRRIWIPKQKSTSGLFVYDVAIDLRTLFCVSTNQHEPEIDKEMIEKLKNAGWVESENVFGKCLVLPKEERDKIIPALAHALINWRITSNQARTFSLMETLAVAISDNANAQAGAIRAKLIDDGSDKPKVKPIVDETAGADVYITLPCAGYVVVQNESADALKSAENQLIEMMKAFDY